MDIPVIFPVGIVISFSRTAVQYIRDCRGVPTEYGDCCHPNSSRWCRDHIRSWPAVLQRSHRSTVCIDRQDSVSSYNLIWSYPQSLWLWVFSVWTSKALQNSRSLMPNSACHQLWGKHLLEKGQKVQQGRWTVSFCDAASEKSQLRPLTKTLS